LYDHFFQWSKNGVMKKKGTNDGDHSGVSHFAGEYILPISPLSNESMKELGLPKEKHSPLLQPGFYS